MNSFLKACLLKIPVVHRYVSRVRERQSAVERERDILNEDLRAVRERQSVAERERDILSADLRAARSAHANVASILEATVSERNRLAADLAEADEGVVPFLFQLLLDRQPRGDEKNQFCRELAAGLSYETLASKILLSSDGRASRRNRERFAPIYERGLPFPRHIISPRDIFPIDIVDVGAQMLNMMDHVYAPMIRDRVCRIVGFEPLGEEAARRAAHEPAVKILPYFIGNGEDVTFHINAFNPTSSIYPSNPDMKKFKGLSIVLPTLSTEPATSRRLDDIITRCDYLKIDVQGAELKVLHGAARLLEEVSAVHLECEFDEVYVGQPLFADIDLYLRAAGFELIDLLEPGYDTYQEAPPGCSGSRLLWNDALYMKRDYLMSDNMLLKAAYIAHVNYLKYDLAAHLLVVYDTRLKTNLGREYEAYFSEDYQRGAAPA
jgi:FkbM family methyltransferase